MEIVWSAIVLTLLPWIGSLPAGMATRKQIKTWYNVSFPQKMFDLCRFLTKQSIGVAAVKCLTVYINYVTCQGMVVLCVKIGWEN